MAQQATPTSEDEKNTANAPAKASHSFIRKPLAIGLLIALLVVAAASAGSWYYFSKRTSNTKATASDSDSAPTQSGNSQANSSNSNGSASSGSSANNNQTPSSGGKQAAPTTPASNKTISITASAFSPNATTVKKGTAVTWTNNDTVNHALATDEETGGPHSPQLKPGESYTFTFSKTGTFHYHCVLVPSLTGTVTVTD